MTKKSPKPAFGKQKIRPRPASGESSEHKDSQSTPVEPACGDFDMRIAADGTWYYRGSPINRKPLVKLFSTVLHRDEEGTYWLQTPAERGRIVVEDAPFTAVEFSVRGEGPAQILEFRTNVDEIVQAGTDHPLRIAVDPETQAPRPYILVRAGLEALILRPVYYQLIEIAVEEQRDGEPVLGLWSNGTFFAFGPGGQA